MFEGEVQKGFGRGGKLLGCPTANLDGAKLQETLLESSTGVYFGWAVRYVKDGILFGSNICRKLG